MNDLIFPVFVSNEIRDRQEISSMPGIYRWSLPSLLKQIPEWIDLGIRAFAIFPCVEKEMKDETGSEILNPNALTYEAARKIKSNWAETLLIGDLALDPYTIHGHDGILDSYGQIANDPTVEILAKASVLAGNSGYDMVAPSDMMDGRVSIISTWIQPICCIRVFWLIPLNFVRLLWTF